MQFDSGEIRFRTMALERGQVVPSHKHNFAHPTMVLEGEVRLDMPGETVLLSAAEPDPRKRVHLVPAGIEHLIVALTKAQVVCLYPIIAERGEAGFW